MSFEDIHGGWMGSAASVAAALTVQELKASPAAPHHLRIQKVVFSNEGTANSFKLEDTNNKVYFGPIYLGANQTFDSGVLPYDIVVDAAENIAVTTTAADHSNTIIFGYTD